MKKAIVPLIILIVIIFIGTVVNVKGDTDKKYTYVSDTERWYYEREAYQYPYYYPPYYYYMPYYYNITDYSPYDIPYYFPFYSSYYYTAYRYRNVKVYEYYLTVLTDLPESAVSGEGWYKEGESVQISASKIVEDGSETKYHFTHWSGDISDASPYGTLVMDRAKTVIANYQASHHLLAGSTPVEVLGIIEDNWYEEGTDKLLSAPELIEADQNTRYVFESWYIDGVKVSGPSISIQMDTPHKLDAKYKVQYYLNVNSPFGNPQGSGWYDEDATVFFEVTSPIEAGIGRKWVFERWSGDVAYTFSQGEIVMNGPKTVNAVWRLDSTVLYVLYGILIAAVIAIVVVFIIVITRYRSGSIPVYKSENLCQQCSYPLLKDFKFCPICGSKQTAATPKKK